MYFANYVLSMGMKRINTYYSLQFTVSGQKQTDYLNLLDFVATYEETSSTALSADPAVAVPLLTISDWIVMQRKVTGGSLSFDQNWAAYRDGFGSAAGNDNYWIGLDKVYRLMQVGSVILRAEVIQPIRRGL